VVRALPFRHRLTSLQHNDRMHHVASALVAGTNPRLVINAVSSAPVPLGRS
jgi:hypothetical protein